MPFNDAQLKNLAKLTGLEKLNLDGTDISDLGLETVGKLANLRELSLSFTSVSDRGLAYLAPLKNVRRLMLAGVKVTRIRLLPPDGMDRTPGTGPDVDSSE